MSMKQVEYGLINAVYQKRPKQSLSRYGVSEFDQNLDHVIPKGVGLLAIWIS